MKLFLNWFIWFIYLVKQVLGDKTESVRKRRTGLLCAPWERAVSFYGCFVKLIGRGDNLFMERRARARDRLTVRWWRAPAGTGARDSWACSSGHSLLGANRRRAEEPADIRLASLHLLASCQLKHIMWGWTQTGTISLWGPVWTKKLHRECFLTVSGS